MPWREFNRDQGWLMPPSLDELIADDHPARVVGAFVDALSRREWLELGVELDPRPNGSAAYHPRAMLGVWIYGFMTGVRSARKLEVACREQLPFLWLSGGQQPDHNTLWRFYHAHREAMRMLLPLTVRTAAELNLVDWGLQAVDGTKIASAAANRWTYTKRQLDNIEKRTVDQIEEMERIHEIGNANAPKRITNQLNEARMLRDRVRMAQDQLRRSGQRFVSLVDADARLMRRAHGGSLTGYNAQAVSVRLDDEGDCALLLVAAEVSQSAVDSGELPRMVEAAAENGAQSEMTVADAGYFAADALGQLRSKDVPVAVPEVREFKDQPYHWRHFLYDEDNDRYICPQGQSLARRQRKYTRNTPARIYRADADTCQACSAFNVCTTSRFGRTITISDDAEALEAHRDWMRSDQAQEALRLRPGLIEPVFSIIKERQGGRRFLLRGYESVQAEWSLLAVAFNLRALSKHWRRVPTVLSRESLEAAIGTSQHRYDQYPGIATAMGGA